MKEKVIAIINKMNEEELKDVIIDMYENGAENADLNKEIAELFHEVFK